MVACGVNACQYHAEFMDNSKEQLDKWRAVTELICKKKLFRITEL